MTSVSAVDPAATPRQSSSTGQAAQSLNDNFDSFLSLLTTQLQNQDPLEPLDNYQMTQQLVAFSQAEQAIGTNSRLDQLLGIMGASNGASNLDYIGRRVEVSGDAAVLQDGESELVYILPEDVSSAKVEIYNAEGDLVKSFDGADTVGLHRYAWDGTDDLGNDLDDGLYRLNVRVENIGEQEVTASTRSSAVVKGVDFVNGEAVLNLGEVVVPVSSVVFVR